MGWSLRGPLRSIQVGGGSRGSGGGEGIEGKKERGKEVERWRETEEVERHKGSKAGS